MQRHYYAIVAEKHYDRVAMRSECNVAEVGDLVSGSNKTTVYSGYKVITEPRFVLYGTGEDDFLNALYWGISPRFPRSHGMCGSWSRKRRMHPMRTSDTVLDAEAKAIRDEEKELAEREEETEA